MRVKARIFFGKNCALGKRFFSAFVSNQKLTSKSLALLLYLISIMPFLLNIQAVN